VEKDTNSQKKIRETKIEEAICTKEFSEKIFGCNILHLDFKWTG
jgi:hypothetical protein